MRGCLFASVRSRCVVSHKSNICISVSASGSGAKSILRRVVTAALTGTVSALQSSLSSVHTVVLFCFFKQTFTVFSSLPVTSRYSVSFFKIQMIRRDAEISILKYSWPRLGARIVHLRGLEQVLYQHRPVLVNLSWALCRTTRIGESSALHTCRGHSCALPSN